MRKILTIIASFFIFMAGVDVLIKVLGSDDIVARYFGGSRRLDLSIDIIVVCLFMLAFAKIIALLEDIRDHLKETSK